MVAVPLKNGKGSTNYGNGSYRRPERAKIALSAQRSSSGYTVAILAGTGWSAKSVGENHLTKSDEIVMLFAIGRRGYCVSSNQRMVWSGIVRNDGG